MTRAVVLTTVIAFGFLAVILRLGDLMLWNHERLSLKAESQYTKEAEIAVRRGVIYDRRGRELALNLDVDSLYSDPSKVKDPSGAARELSSLTGIDYPDLVKKVSEPGRHFVWIKRKLGEREACALRKVLDKSAFGFVTEPKRFYPQGVLASHILGYVDMDNKARAGVESMYDSVLSNKGGKVALEKDASGRVLSQGVQLESKGDNIVLTIDEGLQYIAETALDDCMRKWHAEAATVIMMDPYTGDILAMANRPTFDPNAPGKSSPNALRNRAIMDLYEPGSVFKIVMGSAAIEDNVLRPGERFDCTRGYIIVGGRRYSDVERNGWLTLGQIIQKSSNVGTIQVAMRLGPERLYEYAKKFGFGEKTGIDLPSEAKGRIEKPKNFSATTLASTAIGYEVAVTPIQILRAYSAVANGGLLPTPHIVSEVRTPDGTLIKRFTYPLKRAISGRTAEKMRQIFAEVTEEGGTATKADVDGNHVSGKTGTARLYDPKTHRYSNEYMSTFVGFVPSDRPRIAMIVVVKGAKGAIYGGVVAGPVFSQIAEQAFAYMNVPRDDAIKNNLVMLEDDGRDGTGKAPGWNRN